MRRSLLTVVIAASLTLAAFVPALAQGAAAQRSGGAGAEVITNESVIQMFVAKVPKDLILTKVRTTQSTFDVTPAGLITLNLNKVPTDVIKSMMLASSSASRGGSAAETLGNDAVIQMVSGSLPKDIIVTKIQMSKAGYDLTTNGLIALNQNKVSQDIVKSMMAAAAGTSPNPAAAAGAKPPPAAAKPPPAAAKPPPAGAKPPPPGAKPPPAGTKPPPQR